MTIVGSRPNDLARGLAAIAVVVVMWTTFILLSRHGARGPMTSWDIAALRFGVSGIVMLPWFLRRGLGELSLVQALVLTMAAGPGFALFAYAGFSLAPAAHGAILMPGVLPLMTAIFAAFMLKEPIGRQRRLALALIVGGIACTAYSTMQLPDRTTLIGDALFLAAVSSWAIYTVLARRWQVAPLTAATTIAPLAMAIYMPFYLTFLPSNMAAAPWSEIVAQGAFQGIGAVIVVLLAFTAAVRYLGAQLTTMITAVVPGLAALLAVPLLGEPLSWPIVVGLLLVSVGIVAATLTVRRG